MAIDSLEAAFKIEPKNKEIQKKIPALKQILKQSSSASLPGQDLNESMQSIDRQGMVKDKMKLDLAKVPSQSARNQALSNSNRVPTPSVHMTAEVQK